MKIKAIFILSTLCFFYAANLLSQSVIPQKGTIIHDDKMRPCIQVNIDPEPKTLKKAWKNYMKEYYDINLDGFGFFTNKDLLSAEQVIIKDISSKALDFYTHIVEDENGSEMKVFAAFGYDIYINEDNRPAEYASLQKILENFLRNYLPGYHQELINDTKDRIKDLTDERNEMKDEILKDERKIDELNREIEEVTENLKSNWLKLEIMEKKLERRQAKLKRVLVQINEM